MACYEEYNALTKATEKLHEIYYQEENIDIEFSNARQRTQERLVKSGLSRLVNATPGEIINSLQESKDDELTSLCKIAVSKVQTEAAVKAAEESYHNALRRYEECIKGEKTARNDS